MLSQQLSDRSWATLQESLHDHGEGQLIPISTITSPTSSFPQSKVQAVGGVVVAVHSVDNPWNFGVTLRDPSGEVEVCVHGAALQRFATLRTLGTAVLLKNVTVYKGVGGTTVVLIVALENVGATFTPREEDGPPQSHDNTPPLRKHKRDRVSGEEPSPFVVEMSLGATGGGNDTADDPWNNFLQLPY